MKNARRNRLLLLAAGLALAASSVPCRATGEPYQWPAYSPNLNYRFQDHYPNFSPPTKVLNDVTGVVGTVTSGWWCFRYGSRKNSLVTEAAWTPMLQKMNEEFAYFRDVLGWPPDKRARLGYYSTIYLFGSGLSTDNASNTEKGGWMGSVYYQGQNWPMVLISYYPVYTFDPGCQYTDKAYQQGGVVHEGVHSILADMPGCKQAGWFHEGGNNWLMAEAAARRTGSYSSMGWLSAGAMIAPFMPIECYSGWLQDGSFGGPSAEGVNVYDEAGKQLCTWRNLLGGAQYGESFAHFMGEIVSPGSIAWIWQYCTGRVLEGLATKTGGLGDQQTRRLIKEFRARQAMCDFGKWSPAYKKLLNDNWRLNVHAEYSPSWINCATWTATCYVATTLDRAGRTLTPERRTLPGWSGANQIPLKIETGATVGGASTQIRGSAHFDDTGGTSVAPVSASVYFQPIGANMSCQLVCRATDGSVIYSAPVARGWCTLKPGKPVKNNVVIAVITNTDYAYKGEVTRTAKYDYRLSFGPGVVGTADIYTKWWQ